MSNFTRQGIASITWRDQDTSATDALDVTAENFADEGNTLPQWEGQTATLLDGSEVSTAVDGSFSLRPLDLTQAEFDALEQAKHKGRKIVMEMTHQDGTVETWDPVRLNAAYRDRAGSGRGSLATSIIGGMTVGAIKQSDVRTEVLPDGGA